MAPRACWVSCQGDGTQTRPGDGQVMAGTSPRHTLGLETRGSAPTPATLGLGLSPAALCLE